jgi:hypothetical protein
MSEKKTCIIIPYSLSTLSTSPTLYRCRPKQFVLSQQFHNLCHRYNRRIISRMAHFGLHLHISPLSQSVRGLSSSSPQPSTLVRNVFCICPAGIVQTGFDSLYCCAFFPLLPRPVRLRVLFSRSNSRR